MHGEQNKEELNILKQSKEFASILKSVKDFHIHDKSFTEVLNECSENLKNTHIDII